MWYRSRKVNVGWRWRALIVQVCVLLAVFVYGRRMWSAASTGTVFKYKSQRVFGHKFDRCVSGKSVLLGTCKDRLKERSFVDGLLLFLEIIHVSDTHFFFNLDHRLIIVSFMLKLDYSFIMFGWTHMKGVRLTPSVVFVVSHSNTFIWRAAPFKQFCTQRLKAPFYRYFIQKDK